MEEKEYLDLSVHEMKNILAAISGYSEFIYRGLVHGPKALEMAGKIKHMSDILAAYTDKKYVRFIKSRSVYTRQGMDFTAGGTGKCQERCADEST